MNGMGLLGARRVSFGLGGPRDKHQHHPDRSLAAVPFIAWANLLLLLAALVLVLWQVLHRSDYQPRHRMGDDLDTDDWPVPLFSEVPPTPAERELADRTIAWIREGNEP